MAKYFYNDKDGKTIYINKRASLLSCKCDDCKAKTFY